jgi:hypothetical protein
MRCVTDAAPNRCAYDRRPQRDLMRLATAFFDRYLKGMRPPSILSAIHRWRDRCAAGGGAGVGHFGLEPHYRPEVLPCPCHSMIYRNILPV